MFAKNEFRKNDFPKNDCRATVFDIDRLELKQFPATYKLSEVVNFDGTRDRIYDWDSDYFAGSSVPGAYGIRWNYYFDNMVSSAIRMSFYFY